MLRKWFRHWLGIDEIVRMLVQLGVVEAVDKTKGTIRLGRAFRDARTRRKK